MHIKPISILFAGLLLLAACKDKHQPNLSVKEYFAFTDSGVQTAGIKMIPVNTPRGRFRVWTKRIGNNPRIKVLLLHGGPALTHEYMECFESFFPQQGIEFIEYDQLGSYYSDQPDDSSLWTIDRFVEEVEQVRQALGLNKDNFYLLGNSWGGMLAMEYAFKYQKNLKGLIVANMMSSMRAYETYNGVLRSQMRKSLIDSLQAYETLNQYDNPVYQQLVMQEYYTKHLCRLPEWPDPVLRTFKHLNQKIYVLMQGPSEFKTGGRLINWDRSRDLGQLYIPTLTVGARFDTMDPEHMKWMSRQVKNGQYLYCPNGSHLAMWDDQKVFMEGVIRFIREVDEKAP